MFEHIGIRNVAKKNAPPVPKTVFKEKHEEIALFLYKTFQQYF